MNEPVVVNEHEPSGGRQFGFKNLPAYLRMIDLIARSDERLKLSFDQAIGRLISVDPWYGLFFNRLRFRFGSFVRGWTRTKVGRKWVKIKQRMPTACVCVEGREVWLVINPVFWAYMSLCGDDVKNLPSPKFYDDSKIVGLLHGSPVTEFERVFRACLDKTSFVRMGCVKHELLHVVYKHLTRIASKDDGKDERLSIGAELEVNQYIRDDWLWSFAQTIQLYGLPGKLACEDYARMLPEPRIKEGGGGWCVAEADDHGQDDEDQNQDGKGGNQDQSDRDESSSDAEDDEEDDQNQGGGDDENGSSADGDGDQTQGSKDGGAEGDCDRTGKDHPVQGRGGRGGLGKITFDDHRAMTGQFDDVDDGTEVDQDQDFVPPKQGDPSFDSYIEHKINGYIRTATDEFLFNHGGGRGLLPGEVEQVLKKMDEKTCIPWQALLENYVSDQYEIQPLRSFRRCTRRCDDIFPGKKMDAVHKFVVATDTSGSVSEAELKLFVNEMDRIVRLFDDVPLVWLQCDARVHAVIEYDDPYSMTFGVRGRGGTNFQPIIDWCRENRVPSVILFTDGECPEPNYRGVKVIWVFTPRDESKRSREQLPPSRRKCVVLV